MKEEQNSVPWILIIIALFAFWPVGLYLLAKKVFGNKKTLMKESTGKSLPVFGWILIVIGVLGCLGTIGEGADGSTILVLFIFIGMGSGLILMGKKKKEDAKKYKKYIAIVINQEESNIRNIAASVNLDHDIVKKDLEKMIDKGFFEGAYIDEGKDEIILKKDRQIQIEKNNPDGKTAKVVSCPNCSATNRIYVGGISECEYCGSPLEG